MVFIIFYNKLTIKLIYNYTDQHRMENQVDKQLILS